MKRSRQTKDSGGGKKHRQTKGVVLGGLNGPEDLQPPSGMEWATEQFKARLAEHERLRASPPENVIPDARIAAEAVFDAASLERAKPLDPEKISEYRVRCMHRLAELGADAFLDGDFGGGKDGTDAFYRWLRQVAEPVEALGLTDIAAEMARLFWQHYDASPPKRAREAPRTPRRLHALAYELVSMVQERWTQPDGEPFTRVRGDPSLGDQDPSVYSCVALVLNAAGVCRPIPNIEGTTARNVEEWCSEHAKLVKPTRRRKPKKEKPGRRLKLA